jgi:hypothetical protein
MSEEDVYIPSDSDNGDGYSSVSESSTDDGSSDGGSSMRSDDDAHMLTLSFDRPLNGEEDKELVEMLVMYLGYTVSEELEMAADTNIQTVQVRLPKDEQDLDAGTVQEAVEAFMDGDGFADDAASAELDVLDDIALITWDGIQVFNGLE